MVPALMRRIVIVSDLQVPYVNKRAVAALERFIKAWGPDGVWSVGDVIDAPQLGRWTRGQRGEFSGDLGRHRDEAVRILERLRVTQLSRSNHDDRIELYIQQKASGLLGLSELTTEKFLQLDDIGCTFHRRPWEFAPGWLLCHGDEGGLSADSGKTALTLAKKFGSSVVIGHTHRMGLVYDTDSVNGKVIRTKTGVEVGCLVDVSKMDYIWKQGGAANWQLGFAVLTIGSNGARVTPTLVRMDPDGSFVFEGRLWR